MKKVHTRVKRKKGLNSHFRHYGKLRPKPKTNGAKTFATEEGANAFAKTAGIGKFELVKVKRGKRFMIQQTADKIEKPASTV